MSDQFSNPTLNQEKIEKISPILVKAISKVLESNDDPLTTLKNELSLLKTPFKQKPVMLGKATLPDAALNDLWKSHPSVRNIVFVIGASDVICYEQSKKIATHLNFIHVSLSDITTAFLNSYNDSSMATSIKKLIQETGTCPIEITLFLLKQAIKLKLEDNPKGYIVEGFPSCLQDALEFEKQIQQCCFAIYYKVSFEQVKTQLEYHNEQVVGQLEQKLSLFNDTSASLIDHYKKMNKISIVAAEGHADAIFQSTLQHLVENVNYLGNSVILVGGPASGKGTISELMLKEMICCHISTGDLLRHEIKNETFIGLLLKDTISKGDLVPDDLIMNLLVGKIKQSKRFPLIILDGFPRTVDQAKLLSNYLDITKVVYLECKQETLVSRIVNRGKTSGRADDNESTAQNRISTFLKETVPVLEYYSDKLTTIDGEQSVEQVWLKVQQVFQ